MEIGSLGSIPFSVSTDKILTFSDYGRSGGGRWQKHELLGKKPVLEFIGPDTEKIELKIQLRADHGINPKTELEKLRTMRDTGEVLPFILNGTPVSDNYWVIENISEDVGYWTGEGIILSATVSITLQEYSKEGLINVINSNNS